MSVTKNSEYVIEITGMTAEGNGVGRVENFAIFVPLTAVGDIICARIIKVLSRYAIGKIVEILTPSPARIPVDCGCYNQCGGCEYRHISYEAELALKRDIVADAFTRLGGISTQCDPIIGSERVDFYRNKAQYPIGISAGGSVVSGFYAKRSHRIVECNTCFLQPKTFAEIQGNVVDFLLENNVPIYEEISGKGLIRHIYIRQAEVSHEIMVCLVATRHTIPKIEQLVESLTTQFPDIKSIIVNVNSENTNVILGTKCHIAYGKGSLSDTLCGVKVEVSPLSFYQVNKLQAERLYSKALELANLSNEDVLLDLYCGTGTIGLIASSKVRQVIGVEIVPQAVENALENARINGITNCKFICLDAKKATQKLLCDDISPTIIIVDPPRKGLDPEVITAIATMRPERVVMISCNPATASRDAKALVEVGYEVLKIVPVDMFPRTGHVECVCLMTKL